MPLCPLFRPGLSRSLQVWSVQKTLYSANSSQEWQQNQKAMTPPSSALLVMTLPGGAAEETCPSMLHVRSDLRTNDPEMFHWRKIWLAEVADPTSHFPPSTDKWPVFRGELLATSACTHCILRSLLDLESTFSHRFFDLICS